MKTIAVLRIKMLDLVLLENKQNRYKCINVNMNVYINITNILINTMTCKYCTACIGIIWNMN